MTEIDDGTRVVVVKIWGDEYRARGRSEWQTAAQGVLVFDSQSAFA